MSNDVVDIEKYVYSYFYSNFASAICFCNVCSCRAVAEIAPGCSQVSPGIEAGLRMVLDPDRDLQRIHSLIFTNMPRLETLMNACECQAVYGASDICVIPDGGSPIEDVPSCFKTLNALREAAYALQREHRAYFRRLARDTKYGSKYVIYDKQRIILSDILDFYYLKLRNNICVLCSCRQAPIGDDNYLHLASRAGFDNQLTKRMYELDSLNQRSIETEHYDMGFSRKIVESQRYDDTFRKCLDSDSINRRYENENHLRGYENNSNTIRSIQNDLRKFDHSLHNTLRSDKSEKNTNEKMENHKRLDSTSLLTVDSINLSDTFSRKLGNYDNTRVLGECTLTRRLQDDVPDISCNSMSERGNH